MVRLPAKPAPLRSRSTALPSEPGRGLVNDSAAIGDERDRSGDLAFGDGAPEDFADDFEAHSIRRAEIR